MNNKLANATQWRPAELLGIAGATGAGGFAAVRLLNELLNKSRGHQAPDSEKAIKLMLSNPQQPQGLPGMQEQHNPEKEMHHDQTPFSSPKTAGFEVSPSPSGNSSGYIDGILPIVAGLPAGFLGAKWTYDKYKGHQLDKKTEQARQQYMHELQATQEQMKSAAATPCVDKFCEAIAQELNNGKV